MLNDIMDAVTRKVDELFPGYPVHTGAVKQDLVEPCFFVHFLEPSEKPMVGRRYFRIANMCIQYLPGEVGEVQREINRVTDLLMEGMEYIILEDGSRLRGTGRVAQPDMETRVLTFLVSYNMFVIRQKPNEEPMEDMSAQTEVRRQL